MTRAKDKSSLTPCFHARMSPFSACSLLLALALVLALAGPARTELGVFEIVEGKGVEVCEVCLQNLQRLSADDAMCRRQYNTSFGLMGPAWTKLESLKHLDLLKHVMLFLRPVGYDITGTIFDGDNFPREIQRLDKKGGVELALAELDINNDGRTEPVLKFRYEVCGSTHDLVAFTQVLVVLTQDRKAIDPTKTDLVMQNAQKSPQRPVGFVYEEMYGVFHFGGRYFFDNWDLSANERDTFSIYQAVGDKVTRLCKFRYDRYKERAAGGAQ